MVPKSSVLRHPQNSEKSLPFEFTRRCENEGLQISYWHNGHINLLKHSLFEHNWNSFSSLHGDRSVSQVVCPCRQLLPLEWAQTLWLNLWTSRRDLIFFFLPLCMHCHVMVAFSLSLIHSKCLAELLIYLCIVSFSHRKSLNNTNTGNVNENIKFCNAESPFAKCISPPLFARNKGARRHYPGQGNKSQMG